MKKFPMTVVGAQKLREELNRLKSVERPKLLLQSVKPEAMAI